MATFYKTPSGTEIENAVEAKGTSDWEEDASASNLSGNADFSLKVLQSWALKNELSSRFPRSVAWKIFLGILPEHPSEWLSTCKFLRKKYELLRSDLITFPNSRDVSLDPIVNNPLSQSEESPWNKYFEDSELKAQIELDVRRTYPEVEYFQRNDVRELMVTVLFCYAKTYPELGYIQGMHEILAHLVYILDEDCQNIDSVSQSLRRFTCIDISEVLSIKYLEHDSYFLFEVVMSMLRLWYEGSSDDIHNKQILRRKVVTATPFARPQDQGPTTKAVKRLTLIHDELLKKADPDLWVHLSRLEIPPQLYGIRWVRLMLGREFAFSDVRILWDAIFADFYSQKDRFPLANNEFSSDFSLIEYLIVALLSVIKDKLLLADYITALNLLMHYSAPCSVNHVLQLALYFRSPSLHFPSRFESSAYSKHSLEHNRGYTKVGKSRSASIPRSTASGSVYLSSAQLPGSPQLRNQSSKETRTALVIPGSNEPRECLKSVSKPSVTFSKLGSKFTRSSHSESWDDKNSHKERQMVDVCHLPPRDIMNAPSNHSDTNALVTPVETSSGAELSVARARAESTVAVSFRAAAKLSHIQHSLESRFSTLGLQKDSSLCEALEQISEVVLVLSALKGSNGNGNATCMLPSTSTLSDFQQPNSLEVLEHPLMGSPDS